MAEDITDALRALIEPLKEELITAAQAHYLASIRQEIADAHRHAERALELIGNLIPENTEPHWGLSPYISGDPKKWQEEQAARRAARRSAGPPLNEPVTRDTPKPGEVWAFSGETRFPAPVIGQVQPPNPGQPVEVAIVVHGPVTGQWFRFNAENDPMPLRMVGKGAVPEREDADEPPPERNYDDPLTTAGAYIGGHSHQPDGKFHVDCDACAGIVFPEDEPGPYTDNSPSYQRMTEETDTF